MPGSLWFCDLPGRETADPGFGASVFFRVWKNGGAKKTGNGEDGNSPVDCLRHRSGRTFFFREEMKRRESAGFISGKSPRLQSAVRMIRNGRAIMKTDALNLL